MFLNLFKNRLCNYKHTLTHTMVEFAYMRVVNHVNSKYFSVVFHPTMVYNKVLVDDECGYTIFSKFLEMKIIEEFLFSFTNQWCCTHTKKNKKPSSLHSLSLIHFSWWSRLASQSNISWLRKDISAWTECSNRLCIHTIDTS